MNGNGKPLSSRERQLMTLAAQGETDDGIAHKIGIARGTIATYWTRIRAKMGPHNRVELVARFLQAHEESVIAELNAEIQRLKGTIESGGHDGPQEVGFFRAVLEESPDPVLLVDDDNCIAFSNHVAQRLFGYSEEELLALAIQDLVPEGYHSLHRKHMADYREHSSSRKMGKHTAIHARKKDGAEFFISAALSTVSVANHDWVICSIRPAVAAVRSQTASETKRRQTASPRNASSPSLRAS